MISHSGTSIKTVAVQGLLVPILFLVVACNSGGSPTPTVGLGSTIGTPAASVPTAVPARTPVAETRAPASPTPTSPLPASPLMDSLAVTPLAFADSPILFADYAGSRAATGLEAVQGIGDVFSAENPEAMQRIYEGITIDIDFRSRSVFLKDRVGLDVYAFDRSIWSSEPRREAPGFLLIQGKFDIENVIDNLIELDYTKDSHMGARLLPAWRRFRLLHRSSPAGVGTYAEPGGLA